MRPLLVLGIVLLAAGGGCGGGEADGGGQGEASPSAAQREEGRAEANREREREPQPSGRERVEQASPRDRDVQRQLRAHLRQEAAVASGWTFADVESVLVRGTRAAVETRLAPARREQATSLCLAARRFFLTTGQGQSPFDVVVLAPDGSALARC